MVQGRNLPNCLVITGQQIAAINSRNLCGQNEKTERQNRV